MIRISVFAFLFVMILSASSGAGEVMVSPEPFNRFKPVYLKADRGGTLWSAYYDLNGGIHITNVTDGRDLVVNEGREPFAKGLAFAVAGDHAVAFWMEEIDKKKRLYVRATHDGGRTLGEPILVEDGRTRAFTRLKIGANERGEVVALWYGDTEIGYHRYHYYAVTSTDFGRTFSAVQNLTEGYDFSIYPTLFVDEEYTAIFSYSQREGRRYMIFRKTEDGGKTWATPVEIKEIGIVTLFIEPIRVGTRLHVFWFNAYEDEGPVVEAAYTDDGGLTWTTSVLEDTRGLFVGVMGAAAAEGDLFLAFHGRTDSEDKNGVYVVRSNDNGTSWEAMMTMRHYAFDHTHAEQPAVHAAAGGEVVVVWNDYRNIRSNVYMQFSKDAGRRWQPDDIPLEEPGRFNTALYPYTSSLTKVQDRYVLLVRRFKSDLVMESAHLLLMDFIPQNGGKR